MMTTIRMILMSEHSSDNISNRLARPRENTLQKKYITRFKGHNNTYQLCDRESLLTNLPEFWPYKESLHNRSRLINHGDKIIPVLYIHKELYILSRPRKFQYMKKEVYILSEPSEKKVYPYRLTKQTLVQHSLTLVQHRQNTSWEPATVVSQCNSNSYWIMQENGTDQPKVYRRTRTMLKIRYTNVRETRHSYSQLTESEKAEFHTPAFPNETRNCVKHNSAENVSQDLVHPTKSDTEASASFDSKSEEREEIEEIADVPAPAHTPAPAPVLERVEEQSHTPGSRKSTR